MLVVSRKVTERICIGDSIEVTVLSVQAGQVRLGFGAPRDVRILRSELPQGKRVKAKTATPQE